MFEHNRRIFIPSMRKLAIHEIERISPEDFKVSTKTPLVFVLDNIRSALNVGSVFRTADAFAMAHVYLCGITAQPPHRDILKTALGADESVEWTYLPNTLLALEQLQQQGYRVLALEQAATTTLLQAVPQLAPQPTALVLGNEVSGVEQTVLDRCDGVLEIPQFGTKHSLNVSVCAGIAAWEFVKQLRKL